MSTRMTSKPATRALAIILSLAMSATPVLAQTSTFRRRRRLSTGAIIGIAIGAAVLLIALCIFCILRICCRRRGASRYPSGGAPPNQGFWPLGGRRNAVAPGTNYGPSSEYGPGPNYPASGGQYAYNGKETYTPPNGTGYGGAAQQTGGYAPPAGPPPARVRTGPMGWLNRN